MSKYISKHAPGCSMHKSFNEECADCVYGEPHQAIARENQEAADTQAVRFYFKFYHQLTINPEAIPLLLKAAKLVQKERLVQKHPFSQDYILKSALELLAKAVKKAEGKK